MRTVSEKESRSRFPLSMFWVVLSVLLITAGVQMAILVGMAQAGWSPIVQTQVMVFTGSQPRLSSLCLSGQE